MAIPDDSLDSEFGQDGSAYTTLPRCPDDPVNMLILQTHAAHILGKVRSFIRRQSISETSCAESNFWELDSRLRPLSMIAIQQSAAKRNTPCITSPLIFM